MTRRIAVDSHHPVLSLAVLVFAQNDVILNNSIIVLHWEILDYPAAARITHAEGIVVVRVTLDDEGRVVSASPVAGPRLLLTAATDNAKKWLFQANEKKAAVIIYEFKFEGVCSQPCPSQFTFKQPNHAIIAIGNPLLNNSAQ